MTNQNVRKTLGLAILIVAAGVFQSCKKSSDSTTTASGDWVQQSNFEGVSRSNAVAFEINGKGYLGTGFDGSVRLNDFWQYDPVNNFWEQKANFPGAPRNEAVGFGLLGKGYIGTGTGLNGTTPTNYQDFYEYDPEFNTWTQKADFAGTARYSAVAFSLGNYGYIGTGFDGNYKKDFYKYDPSDDTWHVALSIGGEKRVDAFAFVANGKAYVGGGLNNNLYVKDFFEYTPGAAAVDLGSWTAKRSLDDGQDNRRYGAAAFSINGKGYIATGTYNSALQSTWEYNTVDNSWSAKSGFEGASRTDAVGLTIGNRGFVITGKNGNNRYDDIWELLP